jgi:hypothetical protein
MRAELAQWLPMACLISLDFDLSDSPTRNPGTGMDAVNMLLQHHPVCPVIIHTSLPAESGMMARALRQGGWTVDQVLFNRTSLGPTPRANTCDCISSGMGPGTWLVGRQDDACYGVNRWGAAAVPESGAEALPIPPNGARQRVSDRTNGGTGPGMVIYGKPVKFGPK